MLLSSAPMAGVLSSTLIECWRTDGRIMTGAIGVACEVVPCVAAVAAIDVSNLSWCGAREMRIREMQ